MKKMGLVPLLSVALFVLLGCDLDDDENFHFVTLKVTDVEIPESFNLNESYDIEVTYVRPDDCTFFQGFDVTSPQQTQRDVVAFGSTLVKDVCTVTNDEITVTFNFRVMYTDTYLFRFYTGNDASDNPMYLEFEVPVNMANN